MTWGKASPVLVVAVIFDLARNFFEWFWLFGPALFAVGCTAGMNSYIGTTITQLSGKAVAVGCMALAGVAGYFGVEVTEGFGIMMAAFVGFTGFLTLLLLISMTNSRLFKVNPRGMFSFVGSFGVCEVPFVGAIPAFSISLYLLYRRQIKIEKAALKAWKKEQEENKQNERAGQITEFIQMRDAQLAYGEI